VKFATRTQLLGNESGKIVVKQAIINKVQEKK